MKSDIVTIEIAYKINRMIAESANLIGQLLSSPDDFPAVIQITALVMPSF